MSKLSAFLNPAKPEDKEIIVSSRFHEEDGSVAKFRIRAITQEENDALVKKCTVTTRDRSGGEKKHFDTTRYTRSIVVSGTVYPDFSDAELCAAYGVLDPLAVAPKILLAGEFQKLADAIAELSGIGEDAEAEIDEEAKN